MIGNCHVCIDLPDLSCDLSCDLSRDLIKTYDPYDILHVVRGFCQLTYDSESEYRLVLFAHSPIYLQYVKGSAKDVVWKGLSEKGIVLLYW